MNENEIENLSSFMGIPVKTIALLLGYVKHNCLDPENAILNYHSGFEDGFKNGFEQAKIAMKEAMESQLKLTMELGKVEGFFEGKTQGVNYE